MATRVWQEDSYQQFRKIISSGIEEELGRVLGAKIVRPEESELANIVIGGEESKLVY